MAPLAPVKRRALVGAAAAVILIVGTLLKPAVPAAPPPDETPAPMLQQVVQQREAESIFRRMRAAWPQVARFTARVRPVPPDDLFEIGPADPAYTSDRFGVVVGARRILADLPGLEESAVAHVTLGDGRAFEARVVTRYPERSLALLEAPEGITLDRPVRAGPVSAGTALFAAAPRNDGIVVAPLFIAHASSRELLTTNALDAFRGIPVFELEGQLVGILAYEADQVRLLTLDAALEPSLPALPEPQPPSPAPQP